MRTLMVGAVMLMTALAGCLGNSDDGGLDSFTNTQTPDHTEASANNNTTPPETPNVPEQGDSDGPVLVHGASKQSLAPHPAYGYPTYTDYAGLDTDIPEAWIPPAYNPLPDQVTGMEYIANTTGVAHAAGIAVFGHYVFASGSGPGAIVDISDPTFPVKVADLEAAIRDVDLVAHPDGRLTLLGSSASAGISMWDVTDPARPEVLPPVDVRSHNLAVVPGTPIVYNADSCGGSPETACYGGPLATLGAGSGSTIILDFTDPTAPEVIANIPVHHGTEGAPSGSIPLVMFSHLAMVNADASILIVGDESGGGLANACDANMDTGDQTVAGPTGNLWFYDLSDETDPVLLSMLNPNNPALQDDYQQGVVGGISDPIAYYPPGCTAHFGRLIEDKDQMVIAFYGAGVLLVDFNDPTHPTIVDQYSDGGNAWDVWEFQGYAITGDMKRGVDILKLS